MEILDELVNDIHIQANPPSSDYEDVTVDDGLYRAEAEGSQLVYFVSTGRCWLVPPGRQIPQLNNLLFVNFDEVRNTDWKGHFARETAKFKSRALAAVRQFREVVDPAVVEQVNLIYS